VVELDFFSSLALLSYSSSNFLLYHSRLEGNEGGLRDGSGIERLGRKLATGTAPALSSRRSGGHETAAMKPTTILRLASLLALLQYSAHAFLFLSAKPTHGAAETAVIDTMKGHRFEFSGLSRSYWDFYFGYGLSAIVWGLVEIVLLWQLSTLATDNFSRVRPTIALFVLANVAHAILAWNYFFPAPVVGDVVVAACLAWTFFAAGSGDRA
jgi:hypothetical protein